MPFELAVCLVGVRGAGRYPDGARARRDPRTRVYIPFSLQVALGQDCLPARVGTAGGITLGLTVSIGGLASPVIGRVADATSLRTALTPLILMPAPSWLLFRTLPEPATPKFAATDTATDTGAGTAPVRAPAHPRRETSGQDPTRSADRPPERL